MTEAEVLELALMSFDSIATQFVFGATILTMGLYGTMQRSISLVEQLRELHPDQTFIMSRVFAYCLTTLLSLSIPVCLFFMHQIRGDPRLGAGR
jgi:predicted membrane protein